MHIVPKFSDQQLLVVVPEHIFTKNDRGVYNIFGFWQTKHISPRFSGQRAPWSLELAGVLWTQRGTLNAFPESSISGPLGQFFQLLSKISTHTWNCLFAAKISASCDVIRFLHVCVGTICNVIFSTAWIYKRLTDWRQHSLHVTWASFQSPLAATQLIIPAKCNSWPHPGFYMEKIGAGLGLHHGGGPPSKTPEIFIKTVFIKKRSFNRSAQSQVFCGFILEFWSQG